jgi:hypothetical protein
MSRSLRSVSLVFTAVACCGLAVNGAGKPPADVPVVATFTDAANGTSLQVGSDLGGAYITGSPAGVSSVIQSLKTGSDWMLYTYATSRRGFTPSGRGVRFDLSDQNTFVSGFPTPIGANTVWPAHPKVHCSGIGVDMLAMAQGSVVTCPGSLRLWQTQTGRWYRLAFNPETYPEVDPVKVRCIAGMTSPATGCKTWTVTTAGTTLRGTDPNPKNHTRLLEVDDGGIVIAEGGTYYVSFAMTMTR